MSNLNRRRFLATVAAAAPVVSSGKTSVADDANERIVVGVIGCGGRGVQLG